MFESKDGTSINVVSTWKHSRKMKSCECQTKKISMNSIETQTIVKVDAEVQVDPEEKKEDEKYSSSDNIPESFITNALFRMEKALKENESSTAFRNHMSNSFLSVSTSGGVVPSEMHGLSYEFAACSGKWKSEKQAHEMGMHVTGVSWNSTGSTICVAYGRTDHTSWCCTRPGTRPAFCAWNIFRRDLDVNHPHIICETQCCLTCIACHPQNPALVAVGTFNGKILVFNTALCGTKEDPLIAQSKIDDCFHHEPLSSICWILEYDRRGRRIYGIATTSGGGKVLTWSLENNLLAPSRGFRVSSKSASRNARFGGSSMSFVKSRHHVGVSASSLVVGTESGRIFRCFRSSSERGFKTPKISTQHSKGSANWTSEGLRCLSHVEQSSRLSVRSHVEEYARLIKATRIDDVIFYTSRPDVEKIYPKCKGFEFHAHVGPVYALDTSPHERNAFLTGGADGEIRLCSMLQSKPLRTFDVSCFVYDISWSPNCPMVFAAATLRNGIEIYDMYKDMSHPIHRIGRRRKKGSMDDIEEEDIDDDVRRMTTVSFNPKQRSLLAFGDTLGKVSIYKLPFDITSERAGELEKLNALLNDVDDDSNGGGDNGNDDGTTSSTRSRHSAYDE